MCEMLKDNPIRVQSCCSGSGCNSEENLGKTKYEKNREIMENENQNFNFKVQIAIVVTVPMFIILERVFKKRHFYQKRQFLTKNPFLTKKSFF